MSKKERARWVVMAKVMKSGMTISAQGTVFELMDYGRDDGHCDADPLGLRALRGVDFKHV